MSTKSTAQIVGGRVKEAREVLGLSQRELSEIVGCSKSAITGIESGRSLPSLPLAAQLADALGTTIDYIARGDR